MGWLGDTLWVADPSSGEVRRYAQGAGDPEVRGPRGRLADTPPEPVGRGGLAVPIPTSDPDRWLWTRPAQPPFVPYPLPDDPPGPEFLSLTDEWLMHRVMASLWAGVHELAVDTGDEAPIVIGPDPFEDHPLSAVAPDGSSVTVVVRDHPTLVLYQTQHVFRMDLEGDTVFSVERPADLVRIDGPTVDRISQALGTHPDLQAAVPVPGLEAHFVAGSLYRGPFHPPTSDLLVGTDGRTWLRGIDDGDGPVRWEVLAPTGELDAVFELDRQVRLVAADADGAWGLQDPLGDSPLLVRFEMEPVP
ncbi:MAG: hypothetical protein EA351_02315 [Gemmatimonadales bacterium]|nr:MAG: hypothetical protein EA351_02315 [Gemmatimonadales bacterium]